MRREENPTFFIFLGFALKPVHGGESFANGARSGAVLDLASFIMGDPHWRSAFRKFRGERGDNRYDRKLIS